MRTLILVLIGGLALLLGPTLSHSQYQKQGSGKSKGGKSKGGGFGGSGGSGGPGGMSGYSQFPKMKKGGGGPGMMPGMSPGMPGKSPGKMPGIAPGMSGRFGEKMASPTVLAVPTAPAGMGTGGRGERGGWNADAMALGWFRRADQNGDGALSYDELDEGLRGERDYWDINRDGFIDLGEFREYAQARREQMETERGANGEYSRDGRGGDRDGGSFPFSRGMSFSSRGEQPSRPVVYAPGNLPRELPSWFTERDRDRDGQISLYEWRVSGASLDEFRRYDPNNDGLTTAEEVLRVVTAGEGGDGSGRGPASGGTNPQVVAAAGGSPFSGRPSMQGPRSGGGPGSRFGGAPSGRGGPGGGPDGGRMPFGGGGGGSGRGGRPSGGG